MTFRPRPIIDRSGSLVDGIAPLSIARRQLLIGLAGAALLVANGCAVFSRDSGLDAAHAELESLLRAIDDGANGDLTAIAARIKEQSHSLVAAHEEFEPAFNRKAADRGVSEDELTELVRAYEADRIALRNELLHSQDELHAAVPADAWPDVLEVLNEKGQVMAPARAREA